MRALAAYLLVLVAVSVEAREPVVAREFMVSAAHPLAAQAGDDILARGGSVGVPGVLRMLELAHQKHGRLPWAELFQPAIQAAEQGFPLSPRLYAVLQDEQYLRNDPAALRVYYGKAAGEQIVNREYAATLR